MYDRSKQNPMSSYFTAEEDIAEEPEDDSVGDPTMERTRKRLQSLTLETAVADLVPEEEILLKSCLEEIHDVVGDTVPDSIIITEILHHKFNVERALDAVLSGSFSNPKSKNSANTMNLKVMSLTFHVLCTIH